MGPAFDPRTLEMAAGFWVSLCLGRTLPHVCAVVFGLLLFLCILLLYFVFFQVQAPRQGFQVLACLIFNCLPIKLLLSLVKIQDDGEGGGRGAPHLLALCPSLGGRVGEGLPCFCKLPDLSSFSPFQP